MPQLRALYLPHIRHSVHRDLKELALQVLDIVSIRSELRITYIGLLMKCYQILETCSKGDDLEGDESPANGDDPHDDNDGLSSFDEEPVDLSEDDGQPPSAAPNDTDSFSSDVSDYDTEPDENGASYVRFRLQEILFYDDKISIFKARHGVI